MKEEPLVVVAIRVPVALKGWLQDRAKEEQRSVNFIARKLIEREIEREKAA